METKENNNTASTHQEKARKLKKLRRWQIVVSLLGNFYSPLFINTLDRSVFSFGIISPFECCKDSVLYCISAYC